MDLPSDLPGPEARRRVAIERCNPWDNPHGSSDMPKYLPAGLTKYVLNIFSKKSHPHHVTQDDVSAPLQRLKVEKTTGHQSVRGRGGVIAVLYKTYWGGLSEPSWERDKDLQLSSTHSLRYWAGTSDQHRQTHRFHRRMRIGAAQHELSRNNGQRFLVPGYVCAPRAEWLRRDRDTVFSKGAHFWYKGDDGLWWLGKLVRVRRRLEYTWSDFWTTWGRSRFLSLQRAARPQRGAYEVLSASRST